MVSVLEALRMVQVVGAAVVVASLEQMAVPQVVVAMAVGVVVAAVECTL
jgi:hypothetical protein